MPVSPSLLNLNAGIVTLPSRTSKIVAETVPETCKGTSGAVVPIPTLPDESTTSPVPPTVSKDENRLVEEAVVEKKLVVVALVEVEFRAVKFCKVEEALTRRLPVVARPATVAELTVKRPLAERVRAAVEEVAKVVGEEVAK